MKDANLIIVHDGISNIRKHDPSEKVSDLAKALKSLKEAAPDSEVVMSKLIPKGNRTLNIERNFFSAKVEQFVDHGSLAERGQTIKSYYRDDLIHLSLDGVDMLTANLRTMIVGIRKKRPVLIISTSVSQYMVIETILTIG